MHRWCLKVNIGLNLFHHIQEEYVKEGRLCHEEKTNISFFWRGRVREWGIFMVSDL